MALIELKSKSGAIVGTTHVDDFDYAALSVFVWRKHPTGYVWRSFREGGRKRAVYMHREILGDPPFEAAEVDHINGHRRDNRRLNLRWVTHQGNTQNVRAHRDCKSGSRGVYFEVSSGKWRGRVKAAGNRTLWQGRFDDLQAAEAATAAARKRLLPYSMV